MINPKNICISAAVGFVLSFIIGCVSEVAFLHIVLRALIFAAVFAAMSAGLSYIYKTFLSDGQNSDSLKSDNDASPEKQSSGGLVNIVVDDSTLRDDSSSPKFSVTNPNVFNDDSVDEGKAEANDKKLNSSPGAASSEKNLRKDSSQKDAAKPQAQANTVVDKPGKPDASQNGFVAKDLGSITSKNNGGVQDSSADDIKNDDSSSDAGDQSVSESIDELPDIGNVEFSSSSSSISPSVIEDSDFARGKSGVSSSSAAPGGQNVDTIAQAIRTLLAKDNE